MSVVGPALLLLAAVAQAGHWDGVIRTASGDKAIVVDLARKGDWLGSFRMAAGNAPALRLKDIVIEAGDISFSIEEMPGNPVFHGKLDREATSITGVYKQGDDAYQFELTRMGEPNVADFPASSPLTAQALGDWLSDPKRLRLTLRSGSNGGEGTFETFALSNIQQNGTSISFEIRLIQARFQGTLSGDDLRGEWEQGGRRVSLTFRRKGEAKPN